MVSILFRFNNNKKKSYLRSNLKKPSILFIVFYILRCCYLWFLLGSERRLIILFFIDWVNNFKFCVVSIDSSNLLICFSYWWFDLLVLLIIITVFHVKVYLFCIGIKVLLSEEIINLGINSVFLSFQAALWYCLHFVGYALELL